MTRILLLVPFALFACAGEPQPDVEPRSEVDDAMQQHIAQIFAAHDADASGSLSRAEVEANPWLSAHFERADLDADGQLTQDEAIQHAQDAHEAHCEGGECPHGEGPAEPAPDLVARIMRGIDRAEPVGESAVDRFNRVAWPFALVAGLAALVLGLGALAGGDAPPADPVAAITANADADADVDRVLALRR
jgi:hypothetical protein